MTGWFGGNLWLVWWELEGEVCGKVSGMIGWFDGNLEEKGQGMIGWFGGNLKEKCVEK